MNGGRGSEQGDLAFTCPRLPAADPEPMEDVMGHLRQQITANLKVCTRARCYDAISETARDLGER